MIIFSFSLAELFADLHPARRFLELAIDTEAGVSNDILNIKECMVEKLVIDLKKLNSEISKDGWNFNLNVENEIKLSFNTKKFRIAFFNKIDGSANLKIDKELFSFLVDGNYGIYDKSFDLNVYGDIFDDVGLSIYAKILGFGVTVAPTLYLPVLYIPNDPMRLSIQTSGEKMSAKAAADLNIYSAISLEDGNVPEVKVFDLIENAGFLMSLALEKQIFESLEIGGYANLPIRPGKLTHLRQQQFSWNMQFSNMVGMLDGDKIGSSETEKTDPVYSRVEKEVFHPLSFGAEAVWKPFGSWFAINGLFGMKIKNPYDSKYQMMFPEYNVGATLSFFNFLALSINSGYKNKIFMQSLGFMVNIRLLELNLKIHFEGSDFINSFKGSGAGAFLGIRMGF